MMTVGTGDRDQRLRALAVANRTRFSLADFRASLAGLDRRDACLEAARVLRDRPEIVGRMRVHVFLRAVPGVGHAKIKHVLGREQIWPLKLVRELTVRQRDVIASYLEGPAGSWKANNRREMRDVSNDH